MNIFYGHSSPADSRRATGLLLSPSVPRKIVW